MTSETTTVQWENGYEKGGKYTRHRKKYIINVVVSELSVSGRMPVDLTLEQ